MNKLSKAIEPLFLLIAAFAVTNPILVTFIGNNFSQAGAEALSSYSLIAATAIAAGLILLEKRKWLSATVFSVVIFLLVYYQTKIDEWGTASEFYEDFIKHSLGGFLIGLAIVNYERFLKNICVFAMLWVIVFFFEPITDSMLKTGDEMIVGYLLTSLLVPLIVAYFTIYKKNRIVLIIIAAASILVTLFTSRGCGLTLLLVWATMIYLDKRKNNVKMSKHTLRILIIAVLVYITFSIIIDILLKSGMTFEDGSFIGKLSQGALSSDNGRNDIIDAGLLTLSKYWQTGVGMGADRVIGDYNWVHNIVIELSLNFGIPLAASIILIYFYSVIKRTKNSIDYVAKSMVICFTIRIWVQLLLSSSYLVAMFWITLPLGMAFGLYQSTRKVYVTKK